ncbi:MAG: sugar MFS transporter [Cyclobacteriaceae bacterium]
MWGFITVMNDVLIPHLKSAFDLTFFQAAFIQSAFFGAFFIISLFYFLYSVTKGDLISRIGYKNGILIGLILCSIGCFLFYPAAHFKQYGFFLSALFVLASGVTILQIAANPYAAILGSEETASSRLNLAQGFNSFGTTLAPVIGALLIYKVFSDGNITVDALRIPYITFGLLFLLLAVFIKAVSLPEFKNEEEIQRGSGVLTQRHLVLGMIAIFAYVGGEVSVGSFLINFFGLENIMGMEESEAGKYLSYYWGGAMIGRFLGAVSMGELSDKLRKYLSMAGLMVASFLVIYLLTSVKNEGGIFYLSFIPIEDLSLFLIFLLINYSLFIVSGSKASRVLSVFAGMVVVLLLLVIFLDGYLAFWSAIAIGAFNSILWSNIFTLAIKDLGKQTSQGSSLLVMMIVGGALVPPLQGLLADGLGVQLSFIVPLICYLYVLFYGLSGHKVKHNF